MNRWSRPIRSYKETADLEAELPHLDVLYMTRIQQERFFNEEEYLRLKAATSWTKRCCRRHRRYAGAASAAPHRRDQK